MAIPRVESAFRWATWGLLFLVVLVSVVHALAIQALLERPLQRPTAAMGRTRGGDFLQRIEATGDRAGRTRIRTFEAGLVEDPAGWLDVVLTELP